MPAEPLTASDPRSLGRYLLIGRLGEGGQGIVYLAQTPDGQRVAVKVLKTGADQAARDRLSSEAAAAMRVRPFCTARVLDSSVEGELPFVVSEYIEGQSLQDRVQERGPLGGGELDRLVVYTLNALTAIHSARIIHRDLKPANVLLGADGPRVVDFGISKPMDQQTMSGQLIGTPAYLSPEQLQGRAASRASDVFAWAGTVVFAATGHTPFGQDDIPAVFQAIMHSEPDLTGVPEDLLELLGQCLDKDPAKRPTTGTLYRLLVGSPDDEPEVQLPLPPEPEPQPPQFPPPIPPRPHDATVDRGGSTPPPFRTPPTPPPPPQQQEPEPARPPLQTVPPRGAVETDPGPPPPPTPPRQPNYLERPPPPRTRGRGRVLAVALTSVVLAAAIVGGWLLLAKDDSGGGGGGVPAAYAGRWSGTVQQGGGITSDSTTVLLSLTQGQSKGRLEMTEAKCTGDLQLTNSDQSGLRFDLTITSGSCPSGQLEVYIKGNTLDYHFSGSGSVSGNGTLEHR